MAKLSLYDLAPRVSVDSLSGTKDRVIQIRRVAKVTAGGKNLRFNALVALGDGNGHIGIGLAKANAVPDAVRKAVSVARRNVIKIPMNGTTIPHLTQSKYRSSVVLLRPAVLGTGVVAGATVRAVVELAGVRDILTKSLGNTNPINLAKATIAALASLRPLEDTAPYHLAEETNKGSGTVVHPTRGSEDAS